MSRNEPARAVDPLVGMVLTLAGKSGRFQLTIGENFLFPANLGSLISEALHEQMKDLFLINFPGTDA